MNAILQCISNTEELAKYLITDSFVADLKVAARSRKKNKYGTKGNLTHQVANIVKSMWLGQYDFRFVELLTQGRRKQTFIEPVMPLPSVLI